MPDACHPHPGASKSVQGERSSLVSVLPRGMWITGLSETRMSTYTQANRPMRVKTPLGEDVLLLVGFRGQEAISHLFEFQLELLAENETKIPFEDLLGQKV